MSKRTTQQFAHACGAEFEASVYEKIWVENKENIAIIESGQLNVVQCPNCEGTFLAPMPVLCTNVDAGYAVWYLPQRSDEVLDYVKSYNRQLARVASFYANPPEAGTFEELLLIIREFEQGIRDTGKIDATDLLNQSRVLSETISAKKKSGCALLVSVGIGVSATAMSLLA